MSLSTQLLLLVVVAVAAVAHLTYSSHHFNSRKQHSRIAPVATKNR